MLKSDIESVFYGDKCYFEYLLSLEVIVLRFVLDLRLSGGIKCGFAAPFSAFSLI